MREIKFRIWDKKNKRWFHGATDAESRRLKTDAISLFGEVVIMGEILRDQNTDEAISLNRIKDLIPVQYTGLKDKNGREIYEGDIVVVHRLTTGDSKIGRVKWQWNCARFAFVLDELCYGWHELSHETAEVIGNIYENPELLEGKD